MEDDANVDVLRLSLVFQDDLDFLDSLVNVEYLLVLHEVLVVL